LFLFSAHSKSGISVATPFVDPEDWRNPDTSTQLFLTYTDVYFSPVEPAQPPDDGDDDVAFFGLQPAGDAKPLASGRIHGVLSHWPRNLPRVQPVARSATGSDAPFEDAVTQQGEVDDGERVQRLLVNKDMMKIELRHVLSKPRNRHTHRELQDAVGGYLYKKMATMEGMILATQNFRHKMPMADFVLAQDGQHMTPIYEEGVNVIGILPGHDFGHEGSRAWVVAAHWDVVEDTSGVNDNGSGISAMMEAARVLSSAACFARNQRDTIIFVALDTEETGCVGSLEFVRAFVLPVVQRSFGAKLAGVFVMDTILNADLKPGAQDVPDFFRKMVPNAVADIERHDFTGDFVASIRRDDPGEANMTATFAKYFNALTDHFRVVEFDLKGLPGVEAGGVPPVEKLAEHSYFWLSDHARFWYHRETDGKNVSFPAILLTDTAFNRGYMRSCYHRACDRLTHVDLDEEDFLFLSSITQALVYALNELATHGQSDCPVPEVEKTAEDIIAEADVSQNEIESRQTLLDELVEEPLEKESAHAVGMDGKEGQKGESPTPPSPLSPRPSAGQGESGSASSWFYSASGAATSYHIGTQINIGNLNVALSKSAGSNSRVPSKGGDLSEDESGVHLALGSADVDTDVLANIVRGYFGGDDQRQRNSGKYHNSPMLIRLTPPEAPASEEL